MLAVLAVLLCSIPSPTRPGVTASLVHTGCTSSKAEEASHQSGANPMGGADIVRGIADSLVPSLRPLGTLRQLRGLRAPPRLRVKSFR